MRGSYDEETGDRNVCGYRSQGAESRGSVREQFYDNYVKSLDGGGDELGITKKELVAMILDAKDGGMQMSKLVGRGIVKTYGKKTVLQDVNLTLEEHKIYGMIGRNGAGKTTIFKASLGLIHTDGGEIRIMGKTPRKLKNEDKEKIGVVLSDATFSGILTAKDASAILKKMYHRFDEADFKEKCRRFQIPMDKKIKEMSTGMKAKLKILTALSYNPEFLVLDEPTSGLDVMAREVFWTAAYLYGTGREGNPDQFTHFR